MTNREVAIEIIKRLQHSGFEALLAGGCVRDMLLRRRAKDHDVATSAQPEEVIKLFRRTLKVGAKFGVVVVMVRNQRVEVATFRTESDYVDGRRPSHVEFTSAAFDASRRDFTINGMYYDPLHRKVIDYVDGRKDLRRELIRTIGKPHQRFAEDYLRMLRAVRFSTQLGFAIEPGTMAGIRRGAKNIVKISGERISAELEAILTNPNRAVGASLLIDCGLAKMIFPGMSAEQTELAVDTLKGLRVKVDFALALATFFAGCPVQFALKKCEILKLSRNQKKHIRFLLVNRGRLLDEQMSLGRFRLLLSEPYFWDLHELEKAIQQTDLEHGEAGLAALSKVRSRIRELGDIEIRPRPILNGHELMRLGAVPGPMLGQLSEEVYIAQLEGSLQTKRQAKQWVLAWLQRHREIERNRRIMKGREE